jgi:hypothetical protein
LIERGSIKALHYGEAKLIYAAVQFFCRLAEKYTYTADFMQVYDPISPVFGSHGKNAVPNSLLWPELSEL